MTCCGGAGRGASAGCSRRRQPGQRAGGQPRHGAGRLSAGHRARHRAEAEHRALTDLLVAEAAAPAVRPVLVGDHHDLADPAGRDGPGARQHRAADGQRQRGREAAVAALRRGVDHADPDRPGDRAGQGHQRHRLGGLPGRRCVSLVMRVPVMRDRQVVRGVPEPAGPLRHLPEDRAAVADQVGGQVGRRGHALGGLGRERREPVGEQRLVLGRRAPEPAGRAR